MTEPLYRGYSSVATDGVDTALFDISLIEQDLLNHFNTRIGERVGRPEFGSIIWDVLFDPSDARLESLVIRDAQRIIGMEPRVELLDLTVSMPDDHTIELKIHIKAIQVDMNREFVVRFSQ